MRSALSCGAAANVRLQRRCWRHRAAHSATSVIIRMSTCVLNAGVAPILRRRDRADALQWPHRHPEAGSTWPRLSQSAPAPHKGPGAALRRSPDEPSSSACQLATLVLGETGRMLVAGSSSATPAAFITLSVAHHAGVPRSFKNSSDPGPYSRAMRRALW
jgi:hypothetical protein